MAIARRAPSLTALALSSRLRVHPPTSASALPLAPPPFPTPLAVHLVSSAEVALAVLQQRSYPSIGYMLDGGAHGYEPATTLWELWDADVQGPGMNSRNHIMFGSVGSWMFKWLAGITPLAPGFTRAAIRPAGIGVRNLTHANATVHTPQGHIRTFWRLDASTSPPTLYLSITIPLGSTASVAVPLQHSGSITEGGRPVFRRGAFVPGVEGVTGATASSSGVDLDVASGQYQFVTS